jgi:hypothetical protein
MPPNKALCPDRCTVRSARFARRTVSANVTVFTAPIYLKFNQTWRLLNISRSADIWFFDMISQVLVQQDFSRFKPNPQNPKILYFFSTSNKFAVLPNSRFRHDISNLGTCKLLWTCICIIQLGTPQTMEEVFGYILLISTEQCWQ